ncbi:MAG: recombination mediator RecR [Candidatus Uhrbacteria bacterium]|nr:recombination mediator RecR [Patescibacteria group bacterium]MBU1906778.1 recombination mediator RecR [Patescibacteria group bacterium]
MRKFPEPIENLVAALSRLPGVGPKTALRYVFFLLRSNQADLESLARAVRDLEHIKTCDRCLTYSTQDRCRICRDSKRSDRILCVVAEPRDIATLEATGKFDGYYHVLGGTLNPIEGITPDVLNTKPLMDRLEAGPDIEEVILAFSPDVQGETTILYLTKHIKPLSKKVTRLARGLPLGADLEFADEITLGDAISGRRET